MNNKKYLIIKEVFYALLVALVVFIVMEMIKPNIVQSYINLNVLLILWLIFGMILLVNKKI